jgi:hypothetical protein
MNCLARVQTIVSHPLVQACQELLTDPFPDRAKR